MWSLQVVSHTSLSILKHILIFHSLAPKYDELAELYADVSDKVVVAKIDATANDVPDSITGFPTIKLFPAGKKDEPIDYEGARTVDDLVSFIKENGKYKIDGLAESAEKEESETAPASETPASDDAHDEL